MYSSHKQISQREYAEETVFWSLKQGAQFSARRRTTFLFLSPTADGSPTSYAWIDNTPQVWEELRAVLDKHNPGRIAVDTHREIAFSSGMHAGELSAAADALGEHWTSRFVDVPMVAVEYIGTQIGARLPWYRKLQETAWSIIDEGFSEKVVVPGETTTEDVEWWMRDKIQSLNYTTWFQPSVSIVRPDAPFVGEPPKDSAESVRESRPIIHGDLLHVDFGVTAMGMNTDTQHLGYVLQPGESSNDDVPQGYRDGLRKGNRLQDIVRENMVPGKTGNEILTAARKQMTDEGIDGLIYCHPIGDWGHSAGTVIGKAASGKLPVRERDIE